MADSTTQQTPKPQPAAKTCRNCRGCSKGGSATDPTPESTLKAIPLRKA